MVNSFLDDLRRAYRRRPWRLRAGRRTTYPVLLLDNVTGSNHGYQLLGLVNDIRNELGVFDPLLVIAGSEKVPPDEVSRDAPSVGERALESAPDAGRGYAAWCRQITRDSRKRETMAWYLPVLVPPVPPDGRVSDLVRKDLRAIQPLTVDAPPRDAVCGRRAVRHRRRRHCGRDARPRPCSPSR